MAWSRANIDGVGTDEARRLAELVAQGLRREPYGTLVERFLGGPQITELTGTTVKRYQVGTEAVWDSGRHGNLRVVVTVDDGGWRAFVPRTADFIVAPDGSFVGE